MTWWLILLIFLSGLLLLMALGLPVVISFLVVNLGATIILFGWDAGPPHAYTQHVFRIGELYFVTHRIVRTYG